MKKLKILVPVDFSDCSRRAIDLAFAWALRVHSDIHLVHVVESHASSDAGDVTGVPARKLDALRQEAELELFKFLHERVDRDRIRPIERHLVTGDPAREVLALAARLEIDLIVMGTHGRTGLGRLLMGSVARKVIRRASCPVLSVKPDAPTPSVAPTRILCPVDFSDNSHRALETAADLARRMGAELLLLHVYQVPANTAVDLLMITPSLLADLEKNAEENLAKWKREAEIRGARVSSTAAVLGSPYFDIVRLAGERGCDLIVMGTHGRTGLARVVLGSVATKVLKTASCPVVTVRPGPEPAQKHTGRPAA